MPERPRAIAILCYHTSPLAPLGGTKAGGMNAYVRRIAVEVAATGVAVDVFTRRDSPALPESVEIAPGARLVYVAAGPEEPLETEQMIAFTGAFAEGVEEYRARAGRTYDLLHSHYWLSVQAGETLAPRWDVPHVAMFHTLGEVKLRARASEREPRERLDAERRLLHSVDRIVAGAEHERRLLRQVYRVDPSRVAVIPMGVDLRRFAPRDRAAPRAAIGLPEDGHVLLAVGRIEPLKGFDILIRALAEMTERERVTLVIVGGDERAATALASLRAVAEEVGVGERLRLPGAIPHARLAAYYNAADVVAIPSFYESFGLVALEAMASGVPVVASRVGGLTSTVADGRSGYLIPWRCPEPFAEKLDLLLGNESLRRALGSTAVTLARPYAWETVAASVLSLYEEVVEQHVPGAGMRPAAAAGAR